MFGSVFANQVKNFPTVKVQTEQVGKMPPMLSSLQYIPRTKFEPWTNLKLNSVQLN